MLKWFFYLVISCLACSKSATTPEAATIDGPYRVTATLNDSTWYGAASASRTVALNSETACTKNRIDIGFSTDLPYNSTVPVKVVTGCLGNCIPTQALTFHNIPLAEGKYEISDLNLCAQQQGAVSYYWLLGGDSIVKTYTSLGNSVGWIQITSYNASQQALEGIFEIELSDPDKTARFKNGVFKVLLQ